MAALLVLASVGLSLATRYANLPAEGLIAKVNFAALFRASHPDMTPVAMTGAYASFTYPKCLNAVATQSPASPVLASYDLVHQDIQTWNLAITILDVPSGSIADNNAYHFRKVNPNRFSESQTVVNGTTVHVMTDKMANGFNGVAFLVRGQHQAVVSLNGDDTTGLHDLQSTLQMVLSSWHWRQA